MKIAGGCYLELCEVPPWNRIFGSGGRAAAAVAALSPGTELHTYCPSDRRAATLAAFEQYPVRVFVTPSTSPIAFAYFHSLSTPHVEPPPTRIIRQPAITVAGDVVLRFGFIEGEAVVDADRAVYDPQTGVWPDPFRANASKANRLALVLNESELYGMAGVEDLRAAASIMLAREAAEVVVAKGGTKGASVHTANHATAWIPAYTSDHVFKIGSGDVFSAAFTYYWGEVGMDAVEAADLASRSVAWYCGSRVLPLPTGDMLLSLRAVPLGKPGLIYVAAPYSSIGQRWTLEEARHCLRSLGANVFSPLHDRASGGVGIEECAAALAILDGAESATLAEIDQARALGMPVVVLAEAGMPDTLANLRGAGCRIIDDFATAMYHVIWAAIR